MAARESHTANGLCITKPLRVYLGFHTDRTRPSGSQPSLASRKTFSVADSTCSDSDTLLGQSDTATLCSATALCCYSFPRSLSPYKQVRRHFLTIRVCTRKGVCRLLCSFAAPCFLLHGTAVFSVKAEQQRLPPLSLSFCYFYVENSIFSVCVDTSKGQKDHSGREEMGGTNGKI